MSKYNQGEFPATGYRVVIKQLPVHNRTKSGIILETGDAIKRRQAGQIIGTLVAIGDVAFTGPDWGKGDRDMFKVGTKVIYRRYSGQPFTLDPNDENADRYEICGDSDVYMPVPENMNLTLLKGE
jgi:co-chaperonin GroES (HSP10)